MAHPDRVLVPLLGRPFEDEVVSYALETFPEADVTVLAVVTPLDAPLSEGRSWIGATTERHRPVIARGRSRSRSTATGSGPTPSRDGPATPSRST